MSFAAVTQLAAKSATVDVVNTVSIWLVFNTIGYL
jgi:hypothetical protein